MDILNLTKNALSDYMKSLNEPEYRTKQVFSWLHRERAASFDVMTNIPSSLRERMSAEFSIGGVTLSEKRQSRDGTVKYLFELGDKERIESAAMFYRHGMAVCISTQAGCRMGCAFCASAVGGLSRNLSVSEMLSQIYEIERDTGGRADSVVLMGIGEPLDNFCNVIAFYDMITDKDGSALGNRSVSLSTCGLADNIVRLAELKKQLTLSVSLHAPNDELRNEIMPINGKFALAELMESCRVYRAKTGRRISFEYMVVAGFNDGVRHAEQLAGLIAGMDAHINLIPANEAGRGGYFTERNRADAFMKTLSGLGVNATVRRTLGADIDAACGQLRRNRNLDGKSPDLPSD